MTGRPPKPAILRWESKVVKGDSCWYWRGAKDKDGYGFINDDNQKQVRAHRFSYEFYVGKIKEGNFICHKCDNPSCVNPEHLFQGTPMENMRDKIKKGRLVSSPHEKNGMSKFKIEDIIKIREDDRTNKEISLSYNTTPNYIAEIKRGGVWRGV